MGQKSNLILKEGMFLSIEPWIYIPNFGASKFEDMILITKNGGEFSQTIDMNFDLENYSKGNLTDFPVFIDSFAASVTSIVFKPSS